MQEHTFDGISLQWTVKNCNTRKLIENRRSKIEFRAEHMRFTFIIFSHFAFIFQIDPQSAGVCSKSIFTVERSLILSAEHKFTLPRRMSRERNVNSFRLREHCEECRGHELD